MKAIPQHRAVKAVLVGGTWIELEPQSCHVKEREGCEGLGVLTGKAATEDGGSLRCEVKFVQAVIYADG